MHGCSRAIVVIPIGCFTFDALFNGRSGYRAQYYLSCEEGQQLNRMFVGELLEPARIVYESSLRRPHNWNLVRHSLKGPWSKIWVYGDGVPFQQAPEGELRPWRWVRNDSLSIGLRAPLPQVTAIDFKGTWVSDVDQAYRQDPLKLDRDERLHAKGFA